MSCSPYRDERIKGGITPKQRQQIARFGGIIKQVKANTTDGKFLRVALGMHSLGKGAMDSAIKQWILDRTSIDLDGQSGVLSDGDLNRLDAELIRIKKQVKNIRAIGDNPSMRMWVRRLFYMPNETYEHDVLGGRDLLTDLNVEDSRKNDRIEALETRMQTLSEKMEAISGVSSSEITKVSRGLEDAATRARAKHEDLQLRSRQGEEVDPNDLAKAAEAAKQARSDYVLFKGRDTKNVGQRLYNDVIDVLTGRYGDPETASYRLKERWKTYANVTAVQDAIDFASKFLTDFKQMAISATAQGRMNLELQLKRKGVPEARAKELAAEIYNFEEVKNYFPRQQLAHLNQLRKVNMVVADAADAVGAEDALRKAQQAYKASPTFRRKKAENTSWDLRGDIVDVFREYGNEIINMEFNNAISLKINSHIDAVLQAMGRDMHKPEFANYIDYLVKLTDEYKSKIMGTHESGVADDASRVLMAIKAVQTMGIPNISTPLINRIDGLVHPLVKSGINRLKHHAKYREKHSTVLDEIMKEESTKMTLDMITAQTPRRNSTQHLDQLFDAKEAQEILRIDKDGLEWATGKIADGTGWVANKALVLQRKAETANRTKAFEIGALDELEFLDRAFKQRFLGKRPQIPKWLIQKYNLDPSRYADGVDVTQDDKLIAWRYFQKDRAARAGHEMVAQTQWVYNQANKSWLEGVKVGDFKIGRIAMGLQHYPLSWMAAYRLTAGRLFDLYQAGGAKALFQRSSKEKLLGHMIPQDTFYAMTMGAIHTIGQALRYSSPVVFGSLFSHPGMELITGMVNYFQSDEDQRGRLFFGGAAPLGAVAAPLAAFSSPAMDDVMTALNVGIGHEMYQNGSLWDWANSPISEATKLVTGFNPEASYTRDEYGYKKNFRDGLRDAYGWEAMHSLPKYVDLIDNIMEDDGAGIFYSAARIFGLSPNYEKRARERGKEDKQEQRRQHRPAVR